MARAYSDGSPTIQPQHIVPRPAGIAEAILRGDPTRAYPYIRQITLESGGAIVSVSEAEIREARQMVEELEGISICFSSATAVAGVIKQVRQHGFPRNDTVMINLTGADRNINAIPDNVAWLRREGCDWRPE